MAALIQTTILMVGLVFTPPSATAVGGAAVAVVSAEGQDPEDEVELPKETSDEPAVVHAGDSDDGVDTVTNTASGIVNRADAADANANVVHTASGSDNHSGGHQSAADTTYPPSWQALSPAYHEPSALPIQGRAMYYNPGIMEIVLGNRLAAGNVAVCNECIGYAAMLRVGDLNRKVWIQRRDGTIEGPFHVIDAADVKHIDLLLGRDWVIDVDYETAMRWRMAGPRDVIVLDRPPQLPRQDVQAVDLVPPATQYPIDIYRRTKMKHTSSMGEHMDEIEGLHLQ